MRRANSYCGRLTVDNPAIAGKGGLGCSPSPAILTGGGASASGEEQQHRLGHAGRATRFPRSPVSQPSPVGALAPYLPMASEEEQQLPEQFSADPTLTAFTALFQPSSSPISASSRFPQPGWLRLSRPED